MKSVFRCGTCERVTILDGDQSDAILTLCIPCNKKEKEFIQPERSKREDSPKCEMRCSEHCGNTVREVQ
jgi:hypothetical protein